MALDHVMERLHKDVSMVDVVPLGSVKQVRLQDISRAWLPSHSLDLFHDAGTLFLRARLLTTRVRIRAGSTNRDAEYDDLGAWSRLKRTLTRRWTSQIGVVEDMSPSTSSLEEGGAEANLVGEKVESATKTGQVRARTDLADGMLEVPVPQSMLMKQDGVSSRPSSAGKVSSKGSTNMNNGVMVEEEVPTWLQQYGTW